MSERLTTAALTAEGTFVCLAPHRAELWTNDRDLTQLAVGLVFRTF